MFGTPYICFHKQNTRKKTVWQLCLLKLCGLIHSKIMIIISLVAVAHWKVLGCHHNFQISSCKSASLSFVEISWEVFCWNQFHKMASSIIALHVLTNYRHPNISLGNKKLVGTLYQYVLLQIRTVTWLSDEISSL